MLRKSRNFDRKESNKSFDQAALMKEPEDLA